MQVYKIKGEYSTPFKCLTCGYKWCASDIWRCPNCCSLNIVVCEIKEINKEEKTI